MHVLQPVEQQLVAFMKAADCPDYMIEAFLINCPESDAFDVVMRFVAESSAMHRQTSNMLSEAKATADDALAKAAALTADVKQLKSEVEHLESERDCLRAISLSPVVRNTTKPPSPAAAQRNRRLASLTRRNNQLKTSRSLLVAKVAKLTKKVATLKSQNSTLESELSSANELLTLSSENCIKVNEQLVTYRKTNDELEQMVSDAKTTETQLSAKITDLTDQLATQKEQSLSQEKNLVSAIAEASLLIEKISKQDDEIARLRRERLKLKSRRWREEARLEEEKILERKWRHSHLESNKTAVKVVKDQEVQRLTQANLKLSVELAAALKSRLQVDKLQKELKVAAVEQAKHASQVSDEAKRTAQLKALIENLTVQCMKSTEKEAKLNKLIAELRQEVADLRRQMTSDPILKSFDDRWEERCRTLEPLVNSFGDCDYRHMMAVRHHEEPCIPVERTRKPVISVPAMPRHPPPQPPPPPPPPPPSSSSLSRSTACSTLSISGYQLDPYASYFLDMSNRMLPPPYAPQRHSNGQHFSY